jgi:F-type H+-transporting ATPase subunit b
LEQARADHKAVVQERMDHIGKMSNTVQLTEELYGVAEDILKLEAEVYELKQKSEFTSQVKNTLDSWVRQEAAVREAEQKRLVTQVLENVKTKLQDPKMVIHD